MGAQEGNGLDILWRFQLPEITFRVPGKESRPETGWDSCCGGKIINVYDLRGLAKKVMLTKSTFLPT